MRPTTGPTAYVDDILGSFAPTGRRPQVDRAYAEGRLVREGDPEWRDDVPVRNETIPVRRGGRVIAVVGRHTNLLGVRTPSRLELSYLQTAADLTQMIAAGHFPAPGQRSDHADTPRVGDGFLRVDEQGRVVYASPNALSVYRRLGLSGDLDGLLLSELTRELVPPRRRPDEETLSAVLGGRANRDTEIGTESVALIVRAIPLRPEGEHIGALVLVRDVTDLRRRDRELVTKDATIREIHHRVKNNLQTVAALLRLQARRMDSAGRQGRPRGGGTPGGLDRDRARDAEPGRSRRTSTSTRSPTGSAAMVTDVGSLAGRPGSGGRARSECCLRGGDHGGDGAHRAGPERRGARLRRGGGSDRDRGRRSGDREPVRGPAAVQRRRRRAGLPPASTWTTSTSLGLTIVGTLVESELGGRLPIGAGPGRARHPRRDRRTGLGRVWSAPIRRCGPGPGRCGA